MTEDPLKKFLDALEQVATTGSFLAHDVVRAFEPDQQLTQTVANTLVDRAKSVISSAKEASKLYNQLSPEQKKEWQRDCG